MIDDARSRRRQRAAQPASTGDSRSSTSSRSSCAAVTIVPVLYVFIGGFRTTAADQRRPGRAARPVDVRELRDVLTARATSGARCSTARSSPSARPLGVVIARRHGGVRARALRLPRTRRRCTRSSPPGCCSRSRSAILPLYPACCSNLGLHGTSLGVIIPQVAFALPTTIIILVPFLRAIPDELEDAAVIDGASRLGFFWRILLPLSEPRPRHGRRARLRRAAGTPTCCRCFISRQLPQDWRPLPLGVQTSRRSTRRTPARVLAFTSLAMMPALVFFTLARAPHRRRPHRGGQGIDDDASTTGDTDRRPAAPRPTSRRRPGRGARRRDDRSRRRSRSSYGVWVGAGHDGEEVAPHQHDMSERRRPRRAAARTGSASSPARSAPPRSTPALGALVAACAPSSGSSRRAASASRPSRTRSASPASPPGARPPTRCRWPGVRPSTRSSSSGWPPGSAPTCARSACTRASRPCSMSCATPAGAASRRPSARIRTSSARSAPPTCAGSSRPGVVATLKHFVGYSASKAGRNLAPVSIGPRERRRRAAAAVRDGDPRGRRALGDERVHRHRRRARPRPTPTLLTGLLRDTWGFEGTVVADYFAIAFLQHAARRRGGTGATPPRSRSHAGIDVELPTVKAFGAPLVAAVERRPPRRGRSSTAPCAACCAEGRARPARPGAGSPVPAGARGSRPRRSPESLRGTVDLDPPANRDLAREIAERAVVLLRNDGILPLAAPQRIAVIGPNADDPFAVLGCYSFPAHVGVQHPGSAASASSCRPCSPPCGPSSPTPRSTHVRGTTDRRRRDRRVRRGRRRGRGAPMSSCSRSATAPASSAAARAARAATPRASRCPGAQQDAARRASSRSGTPDGRDAARRPAVRARARRPRSAAAIVQTFFPGEEGTGAIARVLSGRVNPSGRLPVSIPPLPGGAAVDLPRRALGRAQRGVEHRPDGRVPFGHGLGYTTFDWSDAAADPATRSATDGEVAVSLRVRNAGERAGVEVVQLYLHDPVALGRAARAAAHRLRAGRARAGRSPRG